LIILTKSKTQRLIFEMIPCSKLANYQSINRSANRTICGKKSIRWVFPHQFIYS